MDKQLEELKQIVSRLSKRGQKAVLRKARRLLAQQRTEEQKGTPIAGRPDIVQREGDTLNKRDFITGEHHAHTR